MHWFSRRTMLAQTLFAQLQQTVTTSGVLASIGGLPGCFSERVIRGKTYWYYRFQGLDGKETQIYLGPDSNAIRELAARQKHPATQAGKQHLRSLVRSCVGTGCAVVDARQFRLIQRLAQYGFFHAGGLLAGTHAFHAYANMLGIEWRSEAYARTVDVDFAHGGRNISVALPSNLKVDTAGAIESLKEGFLPRFSQGGRSGSWVHASDLDYVIDFITPQTSDSFAPFEFEPLGIALQPLRFLEFSLVNVQQTILMSNSQAVLVNLPDPARYSLHKLIVYAQRQDSPKAQKDLQQAAALIEVLKKDRPDDLIEAWEDLQQRGPGWVRRLAVGLRALEAQYAQEPLTAWVDAYREQEAISASPKWKD